MAITLGAHCVYGPTTIESHRDRLAELMLDRRWPWPLTLLRVRPVPGVHAEFVKKRLGKQAQIDVLSAFDSESSLRVGLLASANERDNNAWAYVDTGREPYPDGRYPYDLRAFCRTPHDRPAAMTAWVELVQELVSLVGAAHASIIAADDEAILRCELWAQHESHEGRELHPKPAIISALAVNRHELGDRGVRPARWATFLSSTHLAAIGGRDRIIDEVRPPIVRNIGDLLYVQLSEQPSDALNTETLAKQRALDKVLAPITLPSA